MEKLTYAFIRKRIEEQTDIIWKYCFKIMSAPDEDTKERLQMQLQSAIEQLKYFNKLRIDYFNTVEQPHNS